jgi:hypothetical protein
MCPEIGHVKLICAMVLLGVSGGIATAETVPLPRPRPASTTASTPAQPQSAVEPSACRLRLTPELAIAPSLPPIEGPGECGAPDVVRLEAIVLPDHSRVTLNPPATLRCGMAEAVAHWVREEAVPRTLDLGAALRGIQNYDSFDCRGRNRVVGARISEHGKGNALDIKGLKLADGRFVELTDPRVSHGYRDGMRASVCARFKTVLGPGSDGYHENHVHVDLAERRGGFSMCHWDVRDPELAPAAAAAAGVVPLPPPRPKIERITAGRKL